MASWTPTRARFWHDAMIDWLLANPDGTLKECAHALGRSYCSIRLVHRSDLFQAEYKRRREEINASLADCLTNNLLRVAKAGTDRMVEALEDQTKIIPVTDVSNIADKALERLGYGAKPQQAPGTTVNVLQVDAGALSEARQLIRQVEQGNTIEYQKKDQDVGLIEHPPHNGAGVGPDGTHGPSPFSIPDSNGYNGAGAAPTDQGRADVGIGRAGPTITIPMAGEEAKEGSDQGLGEGGAAIREQGLAKAGSNG